MAGRRGPRAGARRGAAAAELALLLPFLALLFCVAVDFCRCFSAAQVVGSAARSAALYASGAADCDPSTGAENAAVQAALTEGAVLEPPLQTSNISVNVGGGVATVTVQYPFTPLTGYAGFTTGLTITRSVSMPVAPQPGS